MSLSEQEQKALREIEQSLFADDPTFGSSVSGGDGSYEFSNTGSFTLRGIALVAVGLLMLIGGVALAQQTLGFIALSIVGFLVMFGAGVWMLRGSGPKGVQAPNRKYSTSSQGSASSPSAKRSGGFGSRMEDNFHRRFEDN